MIECISHYKLQRCFSRNWLHYPLVIMDFRPTNKAKGVYNVKGGGGEGKEESTKGNVMG